MRSASEVVVVDRFGIYAEIVKHFVDSGTHRAGATHVVLDVLRIGMIFQICLVDYLMNETGSIFHTGGIGGRIRTVNCASTGRGSGVSSSAT